MQLCCRAESALFTSEKGTEGSSFACSAIVACVIPCYLQFTSCVVSSGASMNRLCAQSSSPPGVSCSTEMVQQ